MVSQYVPRSIGPSASSHGERSPRCGHDRVVAVDADTHVDLVRRHQPALQQVLQQHRFGGGEFRGRPGGVDHQIGGDSVLIVDMDADALLCRFEFRDLAGMYLKLPGELRAGDLGVDLRCDPVPQHIPARRMLGRKCQALVAAEILPDALGERAKLVDDDRGIGIPVVQVGAVLLDDHLQFVEADRGEIDVLGRELGVLDAPEVGVREPAVPRDRVDAAQPTQISQREDRVDRGQPRAEQGDAPVVRRQLVLPLLPRVAHPGRVRRKGFRAGQ